MVGMTFLPGRRKWRSSRSSGCSCLCRCLSFGSRLEIVQVAFDDTSTITASGHVINIDAFFLGYFLCQRRCFNTVAGGVCFLVCSCCSLCRLRSSWCLWCSGSLGGRLWCSSRCVEVRLYIRTRLTNNGYN